MYDPIVHIYVLKAIDEEIIRYKFAAVYTTPNKPNG